MTVIYVRCVGRTSAGRLVDAVAREWRVDRHRNGAQRGWVVKYIIPMEGYRPSGTPERMRNWRRDVPPMAF